MAKKARHTHHGLIYIATESFSCNLDGVPVVVRAGETRVREGHELLRGREHMFKPITAHYEVEQATAAPGEARTAA